MLLHVLSRVPASGAAGAEAAAAREPLRGRAEGAAAQGRTRPEPKPTDRAGHAGGAAEPWQAAAATGQFHVERQIAHQRVATQGERQDANTPPLFCCVSSQCLKGP